MNAPAAAPGATRRRLRHLRRALAYSLLAVLVLAAVAVGIAERLLPLVERHPSELAAWLSERTGQDVAFDRASARWTRRGPLIRLEGLRVGEGAQALAIPQAELLVAVYAGLLPGQPLTELRLSGVDLVLERAEDGRWGLSDVAIAPTAGGDPLALLEGFGEIQVLRTALSLRAPALGLDARLPRIDLRLRVSGRRVRAGVLAWADEAQDPLAAVFDLDRDEGDGRLWVGAERIALAPWSDLLAWRGVALAEGRGALGLWADIEDGRVEGLRVEAALEAVGLRGSTPLAVPGPTPEAPMAQVEPRLALERLEASLRWQGSLAGWRLDAARLRVQALGEEQVLDGLAIGGGERIALRAARVDARPALALLALSGDLPEGLRRWLYLGAPRATLEELAIASDADGDWQGGARISGLGWEPVGTTPAVEGLAGTLALGPGLLELDFDDAPMRALWPSGFGEPVAMQVDGRVLGWREEAGWAFGTDGLRLHGEDFGASARGTLRFQGDGSRPWLELAFEAEPGPLVAAKHFWIRHAMSPVLVDWLDTALVDGTLAGGRAALAGDLDDWPFRDGQGRFDAVAELEGMRLAWRPDWPVAERLDGTATFSGTGLRFEGRGETRGLRLRRILGTIADFRAPVLALEVEGGSRGDAILAYLRDTPLRARWGATLDALSVGGPVSVDLELAQPLKRELGTTRMAGSARIGEGPARETRFNLAFDALEGRMDFSDEGLRAEALQVRVEGEPAELSLAFGPGFVAAPAHALEAELRGRLQASTLLGWNESLAWLRPLITGDADWTVRVDLDRSEPGAPPGEARLEVRSELTGAELRLPAPLRKGPDAPLPLLVRTRLPASAGDVEVRLGQLMRLRGGYGQDGAFGGVVMFGEREWPARPDAGVVVLGQVPVLDAGGWIGFAAAGPGGRGLIGIDLLAGELDVLDRGFPETRLRLERGPELSRIRLDGPLIEGEVEAPHDLALGVRGRFSRLYWPAPRPSLAGAGAGGGGPEVDAAAGDEDPARIPPIRLSVADLRYGEARLGEAELETWPTPEGLHVERLSTRADALQLDASGDWTRLDGRSRSRFALRFEAGSLGAMLDALGFAGMVEGGETTAELVGSWPGSPGAFRLDALDGRLSIDVGEGRLLEVEPGAGRVLGLLSIAEIPRRLTLNFSDFFARGFGFNTLGGSFRFAGGVASTDDLVINGPAAEIRIRGDADLRAQRYDQTIEVLPKAGSVLPALGAIAGGPAGAAVGAVAQAVLNAPIKQAARTVYRVRGPWAEPEVEVIERDRVDDEAPRAPPRAPSDAMPTPAGAEAGDAPAPAPEPDGRRARRGR